MNKAISFNGLYDQFLYRDKEYGQSEGFILEKSSEDLPRRVYFKADEGYLVDHFVLSIFSRVSAKAPESKVHALENNSNHLEPILSDSGNSLKFYLGTNGMTRGYVKNGILKRQIFTHTFPGEREFTKAQIKKFMVSLAKLRILIYVFGLGDLSFANIGYIDKDNNKDGKGTIKVGIIDFITPVKGRRMGSDGFDKPNWEPPYSERFQYPSITLQSELVERLNKIATQFSRKFCGKTFIQSCGGEGEPVLSDYQQAMDEISCPKVKEFDENGYLVSNSEGKKTKFAKVLEEVFESLTKETESLWASDKRSLPQNKSVFLNLARDFCAIKHYKEVIKCRFLDIESIVVEKNVFNRTVELASEIIIEKDVVNKSVKLSPEIAVSCNAFFLDNWISILTVLCSLALLGYYY